MHARITELEEQLRSKDEDLEAARTTSQAEILSLKQQLHE